MNTNFSTATPKIELRNDTKYYEAQTSVCDAVSYIKQNSVSCIDINNNYISKHCVALPHKQYSYYINK